METLSLVIPGPEHEAAVAEYAAAFTASGDHLHGAAGLGSPGLEAYSAWLDMVTRTAAGHPPSGRLPADTYLAMLPQGPMVGIVNIRHSLNDYLLRHGGHIGYSVHPTHRRRGYAKRMLTLALARCRELGIPRALITCNPENTPSSRTIEACGGLLENHYTDPDTGEQTLRYWVTL